MEDTHQGGSIGDLSFPVDFEITSHLGSTEMSAVEESAPYKMNKTPSLLADASPGKGKTMREYSEELSELKKENFSLKLRIYLMEERFKTHWTDDIKELNKMNIDLQVAVSTLRSQLLEKNEFLRKLINTAESQEIAIKSMRQSHELEMKKMSDKLHELEAWKLRNMKNSWLEDRSVEKNSLPSGKEFENKLKAAEEELRAVKEQLGSQQSSSVTEAVTFIDDLNICVGNLALLLESGGSTLAPGVQLLLTRMEGHCEDFKKRLTCNKTGGCHENVKESRTACEKELLRQLLDDHSLMKRKVEEASKELKERDNLINSLKSSLAQTKQFPCGDYVDKSIQMSLSSHSPDKPVISIVEYEALLKEKEVIISSMREKSDKACKSIQSLLKEAGERSEEVKYLKGQLQKREVIIQGLKDKFEARRAKESSSDFGVKNNDKKKEDLLYEGEGLPLDSNVAQDNIERLERNLQTAVARIEELEDCLRDGGVPDRQCMLRSQPGDSMGQKAPMNALQNVPDILSASSIVLSHSCLQGDQSGDIMTDNPNFPASSTFKESLIGVSPLKFPKYLKNSQLNTFLNAKVCQCKNYSEQCGETEFPLLPGGVMCVPVGYKASYELLRVRLEELSDFLQLLLDLEVNGVINLSQVSVEQLEGAQRSLQDSRDLSMSLRGQESLLEVTSSGDSILGDPGVGWQVVGQMCPVCGLLQLYKLGAPPAEINDISVLIRQGREVVPQASLDLTSGQCQPEPILEDPVQTEGDVRLPNAEKNPHAVGSDLFNQPALLTRGLGDVLSPKRSSLGQFESSAVESKIVEDMVESLRCSMSPRSPLIKKMASLDASVFPKVVNMLKSEIVRAMLDKSASYPVPNTISITDVKGLQKVCEELKQNLAEAERKVHYSRMLQKEMEEKVISMERELVSVQQENTKLVEDSTCQLSRIDELQNQLAIIEASNSELQARLDTTSAQLAQVTSQHSDHSKTLLVRLSKMQNEVFNLKTCLGDNAVALSDVRSLVAGFAREVMCTLESTDGFKEDELLNQLNVAQETIRELQESAAVPACNLDDHQELRENAESQEEKLKQTKAKYQKALEKLKEKHEYCLKTDERVVALESEKDDLATHNIALTTQLEAWEEERQELNVALQSLKADKDALSQKLSCVARALRNTDNALFLSEVEPGLVEEDPIRECGDNQNMPSTKTSSFTDRVDVVGEMGVPSDESGRYSGVGFEQGHSDDGDHVRGGDQPVSVERRSPDIGSGLLDATFPQVGLTRCLVTSSAPGASDGPTSEASADSLDNVGELLAQVDSDLQKMTVDRESSKKLIHRLQTEVGELKRDIDSTSGAYQELQRNYATLQSQMDHFVNNYGIKLRRLEHEVEHEFVGVSSIDRETSDEVGIDKISHLKEKIKAAIIKKANSPLKPLRDLSSDYNSSRGFLSESCSSFEYMGNGSLPRMDDKENVSGRSTDILTCAFQQSYCGHNLTMFGAEGVSKRAVAASPEDNSNLSLDDAMMREKIFELSKELESVRGELTRALQQMECYKTKEQNVENAIYKQLTKTRVVLKQAKTNLERGRHVKRK